MPMRPPATAKGEEIRCVEVCTRVYRCGSGETVCLEARRASPRSYLAVARSRAKWKKSTDDAFTPYL